MVKNRFCSTSGRCTMYEPDGTHPTLGEPLQGARKVRFAAVAALHPVFTKRDYVDACQCSRTIRYQGSDLQPRFRLYYVVRVYRSTVLKYFIFPTLPPQIRATYEGLRPPISLHPNTITLFNTADAMGTMGAFISCFSIEENY